MTNAASSSGDSKMVTGLFTDSESVERAYEVVSQRGYGTSDINVVMSDETRRRYFADDRQINTELGRNVEEGGEMGGPMGGPLPPSSRRSSRWVSWRFPAWAWFSRGR